MKTSGIAMMAAGVTIALNGGLFLTRANGVTALGGFQNFDVGVVAVVAGCLVCAAVGWFFGRRTVTLAS